MVVDGEIGSTSNETPVETAPVDTGTPAATETPAVETPAVENVSPVAKKAREVIQNARKGVFEAKKDDKKPVDTPTETDQKPAAIVSPAPVYTPNLKFKANHQEKEFDDFIKPLIKDEETEKKIRKLYEDAHGLEPVKAYAERMKQTYTELNTRFSALDKDLKLLGHQLRSDDLDSFFEGVGYPQEKLFKWFEKKLALLQAGPEQQAEYERTRQLNRQNFELSQENTGFKSAQEMHSVQARTFELDNELIKPEVAPYAQSYDARVGRPGAFREECMNRGFLSWQRLKKDISAAEAVQQMVSLMGNVVPTQQVQTLQPAAVQPGVSNPGQNVVPPQRPVIPNVGGHATSPIKAAPRSLDDLRKLAKNARAGV